MSDTKVWPATLAIAIKPTLCVGCVSAEHQVHPIAQYQGLASQAMSVPSIRN